jgi:hypothetical protein
LSDPEGAQLPVETIISQDYANFQRKRINPRRAATKVASGIDEPVQFLSRSGDTVYLTVVDKDRNVVSFINSIFNGFGSGIAVPETGVLLQNRGALFSLDARHPNRLEGRKRPYHTIIPAMVYKDGKPWVSFGVMGGDMQPQGHVQVLLNMIEFGMNVQDAGEAPRFRDDVVNGLALELAVTHVTNTMGDLLPVTALCALARERGVLSLVDGAQSFGVLDVNLQTMRPDFYSGSVHKWPCGPKETGVLFVAREVHERLSPSVVSLYGGAVGLSRTHEAFGQRDEAALASLGAALEFQDSIGRSVIEARVRALVQRLADGLRRIDGVSLWTSVDPLRSGGILVARPAAIEPRKLVSDLYTRDKIVCAAAGGATRPGVRFSPHFYNTIDEIDRTVAAVRSYV